MATAPAGLVHLSGTINVSWQVAASSLTINSSAQDFMINAATMTTWQATAAIAANGNARAMTWSATLAGAAASGRQFQRTNQKNLSWTVGQACVAVSGESDGIIAGANLKTTVTNYQRCAGACPQAGSEIQVDNLDNGHSIDIVYDGGHEAQLTIDGKSETIGLLCGS